MLLDKLLHPRGVRSWADSVTVLDAKVNGLSSHTLPSHANGNIYMYEHNINRFDPVLPESRIQGLQKTLSGELTTVQVIREVLY